MKKRIDNHVLLAIIACLLWSSAFAGIKIGLQYTTPLQFAGIRFMIAGLLILPFCGNTYQLIRAVKNNHVTVFTITLFQTTFLYILFYSGLQLLPASVSAMIIGSQPVIIAVIAHFWAKSERMTVKKAISILLGSSGVLLISLTRGEVSLNSTTELLGIFLLLAVNVCAGFGNMLVARTKTDMSYLALNCTQLFLGGVMIFVISLPIEGFTWQVKELPYYYSLAWLSFISASALTIWFHLLRTEVLVSDLNIWKFLIPVSGACLSWLLIEGESPEFFSVSGMVLIVLALILLNLKSPRQKPSNLLAGQKRNDYQ